MTCCGDDRDTRRYALLEIAVTEFLEAWDKSLPAQNDCYVFAKLHHFEYEGEDLSPYLDELRKLVL